jgi:hypothetical protein
MLFETLQRYQKTGQPVAFCSYADGGGILVGTVVELTDNEVKFSLISPLGKADEEQVLTFDRIFRLEDIPDYMERLRLFGQISQEIPDSKGQSTRSPIVIRKRLKEAGKTGECVRLQLLDDPSQDYRVMRVDKDFCELDEYGDNPLRVTTNRLVRYNQIESMKWRSSGELVVTELWKRTDPA